ncbi:Neural cell adhesion molecule 1 isoform 1 [Schistosoma japonicum]|uniref:Neural cell adhesion molecule 1 isoform 1 n=1 Tax=Schistosoma japonicum TaxID=6182 RepID=A0A4Z2DHV0_SCHJA|nr:Neural cell adhesion molecule 1 isoform 1 [Schistosoma japonicum]
MKTELQINTRLTSIHRLCNSPRFPVYVFSYLLKIIIMLVIFMPNVPCEQVITPEVSIYDETPDAHTGRVIYLENKTVLINGLVGEKIVIQCNVFNMPRGARIFWRRDSLSGDEVSEVINDGLMSRDMSRWEVGQGKQQDSVRLEIMSLDKSYEGKYTCECQYTGSVEPARVHRILRVFAKPNIVRHMSSYNTDADFGDPVTLQCNADGIPPPFIYWRRTAGASSIIRNFGTVKSGNIIKFDQVEADDAGEYMCYAENSMGRALWRVRLQVRHAPIVRIYPVAPLQKSGCNLRLMCVIDANPPVEQHACQWTSNRTGTITSGSVRTRLTYLNAGLIRDLVLDLEPISRLDFGDLYTCTASNSLGTTTAITMVTESSTEVLLINGRHACNNAVNWIHMNILLLISSQCFNIVFF